MGLNASEIRKGRHFAKIGFWHRFPAGYGLTASAGRARASPLPASLQEPMLHGALAVFAVSLQTGTTRYRHPTQ